MKIKDIELILLDVPFHEVPQRNMERDNHGSAEWRDLAERVKEAPVKSGT